MKTASADLFDLIKSLTPTEKGYFRKFAAAMSGDEKSDYLKLFEAVDHQTNYDESALKKKFRNNAIGKNFAYNKLYLIDLILKVLKNFHRERTVQIEILHMLENNIVLQQRGLFSLARKEVLKLEKFLDKYPIYWAKIICLLIKGDMMRGKNKVQNLRASFESVMETFQVIDDLRVQMLYFSIQYKLYILQYSGLATDRQQLKKELDAIEKQFSEIQLPGGKPNGTHIVFYLTRSFYFDLRKDQKASAENSEAVISCFMKNEHLIRIMFTTFMSSIDYNIRNQVLVNNKAKAEKLLSYLKNIKTFSTHQETIKWVRYYTSLCCVCLKFENYSRFANEEGKAIQMMRSLDEYYNRYPNYDFFYHAACINLLTQRYDKAADHLNYLINDPNFGNQKTLQLEVYTLCVLLYFETNELRLLKYYTDTALRFMAKNKLKDKIEFAIIETIKATGGHPHDAIGQLQKRLKKQFQQFTSPAGYFSYMKWIASARTRSS